MDDMVIDLCCDDASSILDGTSDKEEEEEEEEVKHSEAAKALASSHPADVLQLCLCIRYALGLRATSGPADLERVLSTHHLEGQVRPMFQRFPAYRVYAARTPSAYPVFCPCTHAGSSVAGL